MRFTFVISIVLILSVSTACTDFSEDLHGNWAPEGPEVILNDSDIYVTAQTHLEFKKDDVVIISMLINNQMRYSDSLCFEINGTASIRGYYDTSKDSTITLTLDPASLDISFNRNGAIITNASGKKLDNDTLKQDATQAAIECLTPIIINHTNRYAKMYHCYIKNNILSINLGRDNQLFRHIIID